MVDMRYEMESLHLPVSEWRYIIMRPSTYKRTSVDQIDLCLDMPAHTQPPRQPIYKISALVLPDSRSSGTVSTHSNKIVWRSSFKMHHTDLPLSLQRVKSSSRTEQI